MRIWLENVFGKNVVHETRHQIHKTWICQHNVFLY